MTKEEKYQEVIPQIQSLISGESDLIANMANIAAVLHSTFHFWWTGFYLVKPITNTPSPLRGDEGASSELVLGPFQGPIACTRIPYNKGVCGKGNQGNKKRPRPIRMRSFSVIGSVSFRSGRNGYRFE